MIAPLHMCANLRWSADGQVWADWLLTGLPYGLRPVKDKHAVRALHTALIRSLPGESVLLGVRSGLDPASIVTRMIEGVRLESCPDWVAECEATLDTLDALGPGKRVLWISVPLAHHRTSQWVSHPLHAATATLRDRLGLPRPSIRPEDLHTRLEQAARIAEGIPSAFNPVPATPAQMVWLHTHALSRGLYADTDLPSPADGDLLTPKRGISLPMPLLDEGGQTDLDRKSPARLNPLSRRYLKVTDVSGVDPAPASYQVMQVLSDVPDAGMVFPGSEMIGRIDESGVDVDWALRLTVKTSSEVATANRRALRNLNEQYGQRDGEVSHGLNTLDRAAQDLAEYVSILESDKLEVEVQAAAIFAVGGPSPDAARTQARGLADFLAASGYRLVAPLGGQEELWWQMQPGVPTARIVRDYAQITTSRALAATVPLAGTELGDTFGAVLGLNIAHGPLLADDLPCGPTSVVLHDVEGASDRQVSGSLAVAGELGSGKTTALMVVAGAIIDRGGQLVIADRTAKGEWGSWAEAVSDAVVVNTADPAVSLDPLRVFGPGMGSRALQSFLTPLLNVAPSSDKGVLLAEVLDPAYLEQHHIRSAQALLDHLKTACDLPGAVDLARLIRVFSTRDFGKVIFDDSVPPLTTEDASAIVIRTHTLQLPGRQELEREHLFRQLPLEKVFGRALNALIASLARTLCFADTSRLAGFVVSEAHAMTISPEGEREIVDFVRDGRKHRAVVLLDSHDPEEDFGSPTLRGLIPCRLLMRHRDRTLAQRGLKWLDLDHNDESLVDMVRSTTSPLGPSGVPTHRRGEGIFRDMAGNIGRIKVLLPARQDRAAAIIRGGSAATSPAAVNRPMIMPDGGGP